MYREVGLMQVVEILRRWQAGQSARAIAQATGLARNTVGKYLTEAKRLGLGPQGPVPTNEQLLALARLGQTAPPARAAPRAARLEPHRERIAKWLQEEKLQLTRIAELLEPDVAVTYTTLRRFVRSQGLAAAPRDTVRMADTAPGEVAEFDFGRLGRLTNLTTGKYQLVWAMNIVLVFSRHQFVWPLIYQTLEEVICGLEAAWTFFGGIPRRVIFDNFPAAVAGADALNPVFTRGFLEYSQARKFIADPARVRKPKDKPHTERNVQYVRERLWKGGSFTDLADAREQAKRWCLEVAGGRIHGTTRKLPLVVFRDEEQDHLLPYDGVPYAVPLWGQVTVHPDHHIAFRSADYVVQAATGHGPFIGLFAERLLAGDFPWAKLRQGQKLLRLAEHYSAARLDAACERALVVNLIDVTRVERMLKQALEQEPLPGEPPPPRKVEIPSARFAREGKAFDHRYRGTQEQPVEALL